MLFRKSHEMWKAVLSRFWGFHRARTSARRRLVLTEAGGPPKMADRAQEQEKQETH